MNTNEISGCRKAPGSCRNLRGKTAIPTFGAAIAVLLSALQASGALTPVLETSPDYEAAAAPLRIAEKKAYDFEKSDLRDALRFLADDAGISFIALPETDNQTSTLITFSINASPFTALETIARTYGVALIYDSEIFHMRPIDDKQLIARTYNIKYNTTETPGQSGGGGLQSGLGGGSGTGGSVVGAAGGAAGGLGGGTGGSTGGGTGGTGGAPGGNLAALGGNTQFTTNAEQLINDITALIGIGTTGLNANIAAQGSVGNFSPLMVNPDGTVIAGTNPAAVQQNSGGTGDASTGHVIWNSDTNTLFVVATRQQHQYIEEYLEAIDKPQPLIAVEVKFFETTKDPSRQLGVDWSGVMDGGYNVNLSELSTDVNLDRLGDIVAPQTAILDGNEVNLSIQALLKDRETTTVSYPRVLTKNNRQVDIQSVINQPVLAASSTTTPGVGGTSTASVSYLPIGTSISVLPKRMFDGGISLQVLITISSIVGTEIIDGNPYPVASSRVFTAPLEVESGYTLAIGGLDEATDSTSGTGLPLVGRLPVLRWVFGNREQSRSRKNLMIFITPTLLDPRGGGLTEKPTSVTPVKGPHSEISEPRVHPDGSLVGGVQGFHHAIGWLEAEFKKMNNVVAEGRDETPETRDRLGELIRTTEVLQEQAKDLGHAEPQNADEMEAVRNTLRKIESNLREVRWNLRRQNYKLIGEGKDSAL